MHFYIDPEKIDTQPVDYGPLTGLEATHYNLTASFALSATAKIFACQPGSVVVLPSVSAGKVTVVLKPSAGLDISFQTISYFVYREVDASSFFTGTGALKPESDPSNSALMQRLWTDHQKRKLITPAIPDPTSAAVGFDTTMPGNTSIEKIFANLISAASPLDVKEGDWIGDCTTTSGFEIITDTENLLLDIDYFKRIAGIINIQSMPGGTAQEKFLIELEKQKALNYIDPAAFWGLHYAIGLDFFDSIASTKKRVKGDDLFDKVIDKYTTKNRVYIDIRNERGYSYNFSQNYGTLADRKQIVKVSSAATEYPIHGWPIFFTDTAFGSASKNKVTLNLRLDDNNSPLLFIEDKNLTGKNFIHDLINSSVDPWTKPVVLKFPNKLEGAVRVNISYYLRLFYLRQADEATSPNTVVKTNLGSYADSLFSIKSLPTVTEVTLERAVRQSFVNGHDYSYLANVSTWYDNTMVFFLSETTPLFLTSSKEFFPALDSTTPAKFIKHASFPKNLIVNKTQVGVTSGDVIDVLEVAAYNAESKKASLKESVHALGITKTQLTDLLAAGPATPFGKRFIVFERITPMELKGVDHTPYRKYKLKLQIIGDDGSVSVVSPATDIFVYGTSSFMLASHEFANLFDLEVRPPDPAVMRMWDHAGIWKVSFGSKSYPQLAGEDDVKPDPHPMKATVFFPADRKGISSSTLDISTLSNGSATYPLIVIVHGNGHFFFEYDSLLKHFALNGFIACSILCMTDVGSKTRVRALADHLKNLKTSFSTRIEDRVGLLGHSRGGEAVVRAPRDITVPVDLKNFVGVASLAPTFQYVTPDFNFAIPYYVLYGSMDGDVFGGPIHVHDRITDAFEQEIMVKCGFQMWDRATNQEKYFTFVHGATHNGFVTKTKPAELIWALRNLLSPETQKILCIGYMNAFFRMCVKQEPVWIEYLNGNNKPLSGDTQRIFSQYQHHAPTIVKTFTADPLDTDASDGYVLNQGGILDVHSPHDTKLQKVFLKIKQTLKFTVTTPDVDDKQYLSFRITKRQLDKGMPDLSTMTVELADTTTRQALLVRNYRAVVDPDYRDLHRVGIGDLIAWDKSWRYYFTKSAMITVLIPLTEYTAITRTDVQEIAFDFKSIEGEVEVDDIQFTN